MLETRPFFPGIHVLRIIAATLVVVDHASYVSNGYVVETHRCFYPGRTGVFFFFAISGFVIALQRNKPTREFVWHRFLRIYPSYWIAIIVEIVFRLATSKPVGVTASEALLYPSAVSSDFTAIPYWTLAFEVAFYAVAAFAFALRLHDRTLTFLAIAWVLAINLLGSNPTDVTQYGFPGWSILGSSAAQIFPVGLLCGIHFDRLRKLGRLPYVIAAPCAYLSGIAFPAFSTFQLFAMGVAAAFLIAAVADLPIRSHLVRLLGNSSYGLYLLHFPTAILVATLVSTNVGFGWILAPSLMVGITFGIFDHWLYRTLVRLTKNHAQFR